MLYNDPVGRISVRPDICHGKPCVTGTRIQVAQVLDLVGAGKSFREIIADYFPDLTEDDIRACLAFDNNWGGSLLIKSATAYSLLPRAACPRSRNVLG